MTPTRWMPAGLATVAFACFTPVVNVVKIATGALGSLPAARLFRCPGQPAAARNEREYP